MREWIETYGGVAALDLNSVSLCVREWIETFQPLRGGAGL